MVIRELLDRLEREKQGHVEAAKRIDVLKAEVLLTCRQETKKTRQGRKGASCQGQGEERRAAA